MYCQYNIISNLPELPNSLSSCYYECNPIYEYIKQYFDGETKNYIEHNKNMRRIFANKISNWFLECKYNPKYLYCRQKLMKEYDELYN